MRRDAFSLGVFAGLLLVLIAAALVWPWPAQSHPLPKSSGVKIGLHKICQAIGKCKDRPPHIGPNVPCSEANEGEVRTVYDPILGAEVDWQCRCPFPRSCGWFRLGIRQSAFTAFWREQPRRYVRDWQRACPSIVCKGRLVRHYYPVYRGHAL